MKKGIGEIRGFEERIEKTRNNSAYKKQDEYFYPDEKLPEIDTEDKSYSIEVGVVIDGESFEGYYEFERGVWYVHFGGDTFGHRKTDANEIEKWFYLQKKIETNICVQTGLPCGFPCYDKCPVYKQNYGFDAHKTMFQQMLNKNKK